MPEIGDTHSQTLAGTEMKNVRRGQIHQYCTVVPIERTVIFLFSVVVKIVSASPMSLNA